MHTTAQDTDSIDSLIARQLPAWMSTASADQLIALRRSLVAQQLGQHRWQQVVGRITALDRFAAPLLTAALQAQAGLRLDVRAATLHRVVAVQIPSYVAGVPGSVVHETSRQSLLAAALHNFPFQDTRVQSYAAGSSLLDDDGAELPLSPPVFASLCRTLDIGGQYRAHLRAVLAPPDAAERDRLRAVAVQAHIASLEAAVRLAALKGDIDERSYRQLLPVVNARPVVASDAARVQARLVRVLGKQVVGVVAFEVRHAASQAVEGVIIWIPDDPEGPVTRHASWAKLYQALGTRLREPAYSAFFQRFISERDRPAFVRKLAEGVAQDSGPVELDGRRFPVEGNLFERLGQAQLDKILDDAIVLAVPTDEEDREQRNRRLKSYVSAGLDLLGLATFFVPGLGLPILGIAALQVADEVYEGYKDWQLGDREAALGHVFEVAQTVVMAAVMGGASAAAGGLLERVPQVDELAPVRTASGQLRLRLPRVSEQARHWTGAGRLLRHLDPSLADVTDALAEQLLACTGFDEHQLRRLHLEQGPAPARLLDALQRYRLHEQYPTLRGAAFEARLAQLQLPPSIGERILVRDFPGLTARCAREIVSWANGRQLEQLVDQQRVALGLAEHARWALRDARLDRACAGLLQRQAANADTEQMVLGLVQQWQPWPEAVRVELRQDTAQGELLAQTDIVHASETRIIVKGSTGYVAVDREGTVLATATLDDDLPTAVWLHLDESQKLSMGDGARTGHALAQALASRAGQQRERLPSLLRMAPVRGNVRPPVRLADGRLGYPLSGRAESSRQAIQRGFSQLYPTYTQAQLERYLHGLASQGIDLWEHYRDLQAQLSSLQAALDAWQREPVGLLRMLRRTTVAKRIRRAWRRKSTDVHGNHALQIEGEEVGALPLLPAQVDFSHVTHLTLRGMRLTSIDEQWLRSFRGVTRLDLSDNRLTVLPPGIEQLTGLAGLRLEGNRVVLDAEANRRLASLTLLHELSLSSNPIAEVPAVDALLRLRRLSLRGTGLQGLPRQLLGHPRLEVVDLRDNQIQTLPEDLLEVQRRRLHRLALHDNPLDEASQQRLRQFMAQPDASPARPVQHAGVDGTARDRWTRGFKGIDRIQREQIWDRLREEPGSADFFRFLADLATTSEFANDTAHMQNRIWETIDTCLHNSEVREAVFQQAAEPRGCIDQLLLILSSIEVRVQVVQQTSGLHGLNAERALLRLGRSLYRLDEVNRIAGQYIQELRDNRVAHVDDVEVYLAYRIGLADALGLPAQPGFMYFRQYSMVSRSMLSSARTAVLHGETPVALARSLAGREFWSDYLRETQPEAFERVNQPFHERLEILAGQAALSTEQTYLQRVEEIAWRRAAAEQAMLVRLAQQAYERHPAL